MASKEHSVKQSEYFLTYRQMLWTFLLLLFITQTTASKTKMVLTIS